MIFWHFHRDAQGQSDDEVVPGPPRPVTESEDEYDSDVDDGMTEVTELMEVTEVAEDEVNDDDDDDSDDEYDFDPMYDDDDDGERPEMLPSLAFDGTNPPLITLLERGNVSGTAKSQQTSQHEIEQFKKQFFFLQFALI